MKLNMELDVRKVRLEGCVRERGVVGTGEKF